MIRAGDLDRWREVVLDAGCALDRLNPENFAGIAAKAHRERLRALERELHQRYLDALRREMETIDGRP